MSYAVAPSWVRDGLVFIYRVIPGVRIRALRLSEQQWAELEGFFQRPPDHLWGYPVVRRP